MMPPTVFPAVGDPHKFVPQPWYRKRPFAKQPRRKFLMQNLSSGNIWNDSRIVGAVTLCCLRPIDRVSVPVGDGHLLELLGLPQLGDIKNRKLAQQLREFP
jgi:hypothetical protein